MTMRCPYCQLQVMELRQFDMPIVGELSYDDEEAEYITRYELLPCGHTFLQEDFDVYLRTRKRISERWSKLKNRDLDDKEMRAIQIELDGLREKARKQRRRLKASKL